MNLFERGPAWSRIGPAWSRIGGVPPPPYTPQCWAPGGQQGLAPLLAWGSLGPLASRVPLSEEAREK